MAPITAHFKADFSDFSRAVQQAEIELKGFEADANKVGGSLNRMADQFSGRKVQQDAALMVRAVQEIGGTTKLTEAEFQRLTRTVNEATAKMVAMGQKVPPEFTKITTEANRMQRAFAEMDAARPMVRLSEAMPGALGKLGAFSNGLGQVDRILATMGTNIGPQIGALKELEMALGAVGTVGFGPVGIAALATGGILLAMNTDWEKLNKTIADSTAKFLGWGDVVGQEAAANAHILEEASRNVGREITNMTEAININKEAELSRQRAARDAAHEAFQRVQEQRKWMQDHFQERLRQSQQEKDMADAAAAAYEQYAQRIMAADRAVASETGGLFGEDTIARAQKLILQLGNVDAISRLSAEGQKQLGAAMREAIETMVRLGRGTDERVNDFVHFMLAALEAGRVTSEALADVERQANKTTAATGKMSNAWAQYMTITGGGGGQAGSQGGLIYGIDEAGNPADPIAYGGGGSTTINMNGVLLSNDPGTLQSLRQTINNAVDIGRTRKVTFGSGGRR